MHMDSTTTPTTSKDRFRITWAPHGAVKQVTVTRVGTGARFIGSDWASWDVAYRQAVQKAVGTRTA